MDWYAVDLPPVKFPTATVTESPLHEEAGECEIDAVSQ
jgi:hypothetical protein